MAKWYGNIGYAMTEETEPGVWEPKIIEKPKYGELITDRWNRQSGGELNDNINLANTISVIADPFMIEHCSLIAYATHMGAKWKVTSIDPSQRPRLVLTLGGVYNG